MTREILLVISIIVHSWFFVGTVQKFEPVFFRLITSPTLSYTLLSFSHRIPEEKVMRYYISLNYLDVLSLSFSLIKLYYTTTTTSLKFRVFIGTCWFCVLWCIYALKNHVLEYIAFIMLNFLYWDPSIAFYLNKKCTFRKATLRLFLRYGFYCIWLRLSI